MAGHIIRQGREAVDRATIARVLTLGRFCAQGLELSRREHWCATTALGDPLEVDAAEVCDNRLCRGLDQLLPPREKLSRHLQERYRSRFGVRFEVLLHDVISTCFEGRLDAALRERPQKLESAG